MIFTATVKSAGEKPGTFIVSPHRIMVDGTQRPGIMAYAADGIKPPNNSLVLCVESVNPYTHQLTQDINNNGGACPVIVAQFNDEIIRNVVLKVLKDLFVSGNSFLEGSATLGAGTNKMVLGEPLQDVVEKLIDCVTALYNWGATGTGAAGSIPPFPGAPPVPSWSADTLSEKHKLD